MKVAIVAPPDLPIPPTRGGSVQIYLSELLQSFGELKKWDITLISPGKGEPLGESQHLHVTSPSSEYLSNVLRYIEARRPDVVQIDNRPEFVPAIRNAFPRQLVLLNLHSTTFLGPRHLNSTLAHRILATTPTVVNSNYLKEKIRRRFHLTHQGSNMHVIYPGVRSEYFKSASNTHVALADEVLRVLYVGRVIQQKGVDKLIMAVRQLREMRYDVELTVIGKTPPWERKYAEKLQNLSQDSPVHHLGFIPPKILPVYYQEADLFVCPSQRNEAFGLVNLEAMAAGLPVIASNQGGIREIVNESCGILVHRYHHASEFAKAILRLSQDESTYQALRAGAQKRAAEFTWNKTAQSFGELYNTLIH